MLLKNVQKKAAELNNLKCELIITDVNGKSFKSFFRNVEFIIWGATKLPSDMHRILECNGEHTDEVCDAVDIRKIYYKNFKYKAFKCLYMYIFK